MRKSLFTVLSSFIFCLGAFGAEQLLVKATNQEDREITKLFLGLDDMNDINDFKVKAFDGKELLSEKEFQISDGKSGIVLAEMKGREIVKLYSSNFSSHQGGNISMEFLNNGITGKRKIQEFDLVRTGDKWELLLNGEVVEHLHFVSNKKTFVGTIGVKKIEVVK